VKVHDSVWHISHFAIMFRILLSALLGGAIGLEREWSNHAAGFRTHILVCLGSTSIMLLSIYGFNQFIDETNVRVDPARLAAQVISGIGFLGAGAIIRNGVSVSGLTTAASIWVVAAIGLSVGAGFFYAAILITIMVLLSLFALNKWEKYLMRGRRDRELIIQVADKPGMLGKVAGGLGEFHIQIKNVQMKHLDEPPSPNHSTGVVELRITVRCHDQDLLMQSIEKIGVMPEVFMIQAARPGNYGLVARMSEKQAV
jgi:putative Mg2+ transporter-C (MgtC) family protein